MRKIICFILIIITFGALGVNAADKFVLVIDAGHGGHDPGARGKVSLEKNINLSVALAFGKYVERNCPDVKVIYTRKTDVFIELSERANIANKNKADLFISIHTNALDGGKISRGVETYTLGIYKAAENLNVAKRENSVILIEKNYKQRYAGFDPNSSESYIMFELMQDKNMANSVELAKTIQSEVCASSGRVNKGVHQAGFLVLRETSMPSCLLELGFITTTDEETYLNTTEGQDKMARGIYNAFVKYKRKHGMKLAQNDDNESQDYENPEYDMVSNGMLSSVEELAEGETPESRQYDNDRELSPNERRMAEEASHIIKEEDELMMTMTEYAQPREVRSLENFLAQTIPPVEPQPGVGQEQNVQPPESPGLGTKGKARENTKLMAADNTTKGPPVEIAPTTPEKTPKPDSATASTTPTKSAETTEPEKSSIDTTPEKENTTVSQSQPTTSSTHQKDL
ncbi:MAG: N-acetylmuramoyl-L-alanine amidase, partial [Prevotella sp.]|nr:N-acetylmuramoyl-L-alanine amidase [Prevotella sp.]